MNFDYSYTKRRADFGKRCLFRDRGPNLFLDIRSDPVLNNQFVYKRFMNKGVQVAPIMTLSEINVEKKMVEARGMFHSEGGWPKEVNPRDEEQVERYQKRTQRDDIYVEVLSRLAQKMEKAVLQNNSMNIFKSYFKNTTSVANRLEACGMILNVFMSNNEDSPRCEVRKLSWRSSSEIVVTLTEGCSYVWCLHNPNEPFLSLSSASYMNVLKFHPKENRIAGGLGTGQVALWDGRTGGDPKCVSSRERSHRSEVVELIWIASKTSTEFMTAGTSGVIKWWDYLKIKKPKEEVSYGVPLTSLEYDPNMPIRFMFGSADGYIVCGNRRGTTQQEKLPWKIKVSDAAVYRISRNPAFPKILLIVGGNSANVWSEDCKEAALFWTAPSQSVITDAEWSPVRYSVVVTAREDGFVDVWDFLERRNAPVFTIRVDEHKLMSMAFYEEGDLVAVGTSQGAMYAIRLSEYLVTMTAEEKAQLAATFDREVAREKIIESKKREFRLKVKSVKPEEMKQTLSDREELAEASTADVSLKPDGPLEVETATEETGSDTEEMSSEKALEKSSSYVERLPVTDTTSEHWLAGLGDIFLQQTKEIIDASLACSYPYRPILSDDDNDEDQEI